MTHYIFLLLLSFSLKCNALRTASRLTPDCLSGVNYTVAVETCASQSGELCTHDEIWLQQLGMGIECGFDNYHTWTSTPCNSGTDSHWIATTGTGPPGNNPCQDQQTPECTLDIYTFGLSNACGTQDIAVVCCFDTGEPTADPTTSPTRNPSATTRNPSSSPTKTPSTSPTRNPSSSPTKTPSTSPTRNPSAAPTKTPSQSPTGFPSATPSTSPTRNPSSAPSTGPTGDPTVAPTNVPSQAPIMTTESASEDDSYEDSFDSDDVDAAAMQHMRTMDSDTSVETKHVYLNIKVDGKTAINVVVMIIIFVFSNIFLYFCLCKT